jgi:hypothetical protein
MVIENDSAMELREDDRATQCTKMKQLISIVHDFVPPVVLIAFTTSGRHPHRRVTDTLECPGGRGMPSFRVEARCPVQMINN